MKTLLLTLVSFWLIFSGAGCSKLVQYARSRTASLPVLADSADEAEDPAVKADADITGTNSYLDFSYTIPKNWWLYKLNEANFSADPSETEELGLLDIDYGEDAGMNYSFIDLVSFGNLEDSRRDNHIGFDISAETLDGIASMTGYMEYFENFMLEPDENTYKLLDSGRAEINGLQYETRVIEVVREEDNFIYLTYTRPVKNNYYLTIKASYWPENKNARDFIEKSLAKAMP